MPDSNQPMVHSEFESKMLDLLKIRKRELQPAIEEWGWQTKMLEIVEHAIKDRGKGKRKNISWKEVNEWFIDLEPTATLKRSDIALALGVSEFQAKRIIDKLVGEGKMEKWGRGLWRKTPIRTGTATIRTTTK